jgi:ATP-binding cassette subfamily B protein RaxB
MLRLHCERLADIVLTPPENESGTAEPVLAVAPRIEAEGISFRYGDGEPWVLQNCSFTVEAGESLAIVGASGCGKTTLVKILLGLLRPSTGTVRIDGRDLQRLGPRQLRNITGVVMQDDQLFAGSIADNIAFFDPSTDPARIEAAARLAAIHDEIALMPMGYQSLIGDMGDALSGGQKQRVMLARALYRKPKLLFLDEATSHLDIAREQHVTEAIRRLKLTRIVVAHRPETIAIADRVLMMEGGRVTQELASPLGRERRPVSNVVGDQATGSTTTSVFTELAI